MTDMQQGESPPPAGWYPDPVRPGSTRYWSGTGWTDQVNTPTESPDPTTDLSGSPELSGSPSFKFDVSPVVEPPPISFGAAPVQTEQRASQSEWHQTRARPVQRTGAPSVSTTAGVASNLSARRHDPYDLNWVAGVAIVLAILSIPGLAVRVLMDLHPLTDGIIAGAPLAISLLALVRASRKRSGIILSVVALVISAATLVSAWLVDPALIQTAVDAVLGLIPA